LLARIKTRWLGGLLASLAVASGLALGLPLARTPASVAGNSNDAIDQAFCATYSPEAVVRPGDTVNRRYEVDVPTETPPIGLPSGAIHQVAKGDVVEFAVASPRPGRVAVHGLFDAEPVQVGTVVKVAFRAVYTGRFPLHFHGSDGSHFEIAALEVLPQAPVAGKSAKR
jgi:hypothetical protein